MENPEMTDESFAAIYGLDNRSPAFGGSFNPENPYQRPQYQYYNGVNPYSSGYNGG